MPTSLIVASPPWATSASTSQPMASMPARMLLCTREIIGASPANNRPYGTGKCRPWQAPTYDEAAICCAPHQQPPSEVSKTSPEFFGPSRLLCSPLRNEARPRTICLPSVAWQTDPPEEVRPLLEAVDRRLTEPLRQRKPRCECGSGLHWRCAVAREDSRRMVPSWKPHPEVQYVLPKDLLGQPSPEVAIDSRTRPLAA